MINSHSTNPDVAKVGGRLGTRIELAVHGYRGRFGIRHLLAPLLNQGSFAFRFDAAGVLSCRRNSAELGANPCEREEYRVDCQETDGKVNISLADQ